MHSSLKFMNQNVPYVGIFGSGLSGQGAAKLCQALHWPYEIIDEKIGKEPKFGTYMLCVFSPGFPPNHRWWQAAQASSALCINELDFAASCLENSAIIAVTGTNGKTSMVNLITALLEENQKPALAVGNNGVVLSSIVANQAFPAHCIFVCEISSYQAWSLKLMHPKYTLWTNIAPDHLTYHGNFNAYIKAKMHLLDLTQGSIICGQTLKQIAGMPSNVTFSAPSQKEDSIYLAGFSFGQRENFQLLRTFAEMLSISQNSIASVLQNFRPPAHRLYCCRKCGSVEFWNDAKATNLHAVHAALESLKYKPNLHWILGGQDKGERLKNFIDTFNQYPNVKTVYTIGSMGPVLAQQSHLFKATIINCGTLDQVFKHFPMQSATLVLSPGFTSWDQYPSFEKRGEHFELLTKRISDLIMLD